MEFEINVGLKFRNDTLNIFYRSLSCITFSGFFRGMFVNMFYSNGFESLMKTCSAGVLCLVPLPVVGSSSLCYSSCTDPMRAAECSVRISIIVKYP